MTRGNSQEPLYPLVSEIERLFHQRRRENKTQRTMNRGNQLADGQNDQPVDGNVGALARPRAIRDHLTPILDDLNPGIVAPEIQAADFELKHVMFNMLNSIGQFGGSSHEDARQHIRAFLEVCDSFRQQGVHEDVLNLKLFPYSLRDRARAWLSGVPAGSYVLQWSECSDSYDVRCSDTEVAKGVTHEQCKAITTRSGKVLTQTSNQRGTAVVPSSAIDIPAEADESAQTSKDHSDPHNTNNGELKKQKQDYQFKKFFDILKQVHINLPLVEALQQMPNYAKFLKDMVTRKRRIEEFETAAATETCMALMHNKVPAKKTDPGSFTIKCFIGHNYPIKALCDPGESINLMPKSVFRRLGIGEAKPTTVMMQLADHSYVQPKRKIDDILVQVDKFIFPADFLILYCEADEHATIILGRPFLSTSRAIIDFDKDEIIFKVDDDKVKMKSLTKQLDKGKGIDSTPAKDTPKPKLYMGAHVERDRTVMFLRDA
ncbi:hypothetical protein GQ457_14G000160 [Hibiscus cannabinus]